MTSSFPWDDNSFAWRHSRYMHSSRWWQVGENNCYWTRCSTHLSSSNPSPPHPPPSRIKNYYCWFWTVSLSPSVRSPPTLLSSCYMSTNYVTCYEFDMTTTSRFCSSSCIPYRPTISRCRVFCRRLSVSWTSWLVCCGVWEWEGEKEREAVGEWCSVFQRVYSLFLFYCWSYVFRGVSAQDFRLDWPDKKRVFQIRKIF